MASAIPTYKPTISFEEARNMPITELQQRLVFEYGGNLYPCTAISKGNKPSVGDYFVVKFNIIEVESADTVTDHARYFLWWDAGFNEATLVEA